MGVNHGKYITWGNIYRKTYCVDDYGKAQINHAYRTYICSNKNENQWFLLQPLTQNTPTKPTTPTTKPTIPTTPTTKPTTPTNPHSLAEAQNAILFGSIPF